MYHPIVKEQVIPGQLEGLQTNHHSTEAPSKCQALTPVENSATCGFLVALAGYRLLPFEDCTGLSYVAAIRNHFVYLDCIVQNVWNPSFDCEFNDRIIRAES
jgi:hypothetical protein